MAAEDDRLFLQKAAEQGDGRKGTDVMVAYPVYLE
jgi:hypothetical protein